MYIVRQGYVCEMSVAWVLFHGYEMDGFLILARWFPCLGFDNFLLFVWSKGRGEDGLMVRGFWIGYGVLTDFKVNMKLFPVRDLSTGCKLSCATFPFLHRFHSILSRSRIAYLSMPQKHSPRHRVKDLRVGMLKTVEDIMY